MLCSEHTSHMRTCARRSTLQTHSGHATAACTRSILSIRLVGRSQAAFGCRQAGHAYVQVPGPVTRPMLGLLSSRPTTSRAAAAASEAAASNGSVTSNSNGPIMVWFKADLRVDDHEGLLQAAAQAGDAGLLPLFCLDPMQLHPLAFLPAGPEVLAGLLKELRVMLQARGSDLLIVRGRWQDEVPAAAQRFGARCVLAQQEVEHMLSDPASAVAASLQQAGVEYHTWDTFIWPPAAFNHNFRQWRAGRPAAQAPKPAPSRLPALPSICSDTGALPDAAELRTLLASDPPTHMHAAGAMRQEVEPQLLAAKEGPAALRQQQLIAYGHDWLQRLAVYLSMKDRISVNRDTSSISGSVSGSMDSDSSGQAMLAAVIKEGIKATETPAAEGYSFPALFAVALSLGALSRRRVYEEAMAAGGTSCLPTRAAATTAESADFHWQLSLRNDKRPEVPDGVQFRHWRWNGFITDYMVSEPAPDTALLDDAPAVLLLHGFGAFGDQWRDNLVELAAAGYRVYAPTLPGFGRSEKASVPYSQVLWGNFLRDFVVQVVGSQVVLAGNSIGGFIGASTAADHPSVVRGLVLLNSAGPIDAAPFSMDLWQKQAAARKPPPKWVVQMVSGGLFWYLERTVPGTLTWLYPTNPDRAKGWLAEEITRAAADVGAVEVFGSVFYLPPPRPLNWLIKECYKGPTLVLQGVLDPLNDAKARAKQLKELVPELVEVKEVQAGHCPHDEVPHEVNQAMLEWIGRVVYPQQAPGSQIAAEKQDQQQRMAAAVTTDGQ